MFSPESLIGSPGKWNVRFMRLAREVSTWSKDPGTHVGAVLVRDRRILAVGFNGLPRGMRDDSRLEDRGWKLAHTVHAELNAVLDCAARGVPTSGASLYVWGLPICPDCAKSVVQAGVSRVFVPPLEEASESWRRAFLETSWPLLDEAGVVVNSVDVS